MTLRYLLATAVLLLGACTTSPKHEPPPLYHTGPLDESSATPSIDYVALQRHLRMERAPEQLGYTEKIFNTCDAGYGFSRSQNCRKEYFVVIHFQLLCRNSVGTVSEVLTDQDLTPLGGRNIRWQLKDVDGMLQTNGWGYGQLLITSPISQRRQRIRLALGNEFLYMRANEINKVITPAPWCSQY